MSRELQITFQGASANLYAVIRRISDGYAWNGSAFVAWADGSIADYDIALTDRGGDVYDADWPTAMAAGDYRVVFYERSGASPPITDLVLATVDRHWNGTAATSTSTVTLSAYALTSLDSIKRRLGIDDSDDDTLLTELINGVSMEIERICARRFVARNYVERYDLARDRRVNLQHFPVIGVNRIAYGMANAITVSYSGSAVRANVSVYHDGTDAGGTNAGVRLTTVASNGTRTTNNLLFTDYPSTDSLATAISAVTGWTAALVANVPSSDLNPIANDDVLNSSASSSAQLTYPDASINCTVDHDTGAVEIAQNEHWYRWGQARDPKAIAPQAMRFGWGHQYLMVDYRAGFETIPDDVAMVANRLVQEEYHVIQLGTGVTEVKLGPATLKMSDTTEGWVRESLSHYIDLSRSVA